MVQRSPVLCGVLAVVSRLSEYLLRFLEADVSLTSVGKTVLASIIVNSLQLPDYRDTFSQKETLVLSIFCEYQSANSQTVENVLRSLLRQRVQEHGLSDSIASLHNDNTPLCLNDLTTILAQELKSFDHVYMILDALDEFPENDGGQEMLVNMLQELGSKTRLPVMSRDIPAIGSLFKTDTWLDIWATDEDIKTKLSSGRLAHHIKGRDNLREEILSGVTNKTDGMCVNHAATCVCPQKRPLS